MNKCFLLLGRTGDLINCLPIFFAESQSTGVPANVMCCKQYAPLFGGTSYVNCIPFDGQDNELRRAYEIAKKDFDPVVSLQVIGNTKDVLELTYQPAGVTAAQTDSFQKEPYWLTGNQKLWAQQPRPVFDGRSKARERKLVESCPGNLAQNILVAAGGRSSPFPYKDVLFELLIGRFPKFGVVDLSTFQTERFYDFIGLIERAFCIVATDSAFLHLAHACADLPVCAITNDKPMLWFGSAWRANHVSYIRYSDFPIRAVEMLDAIERITSSPYKWLPSDAPRLLHAWSRYEETEENKERRIAADRTWDAAYQRDDWIDCPAEIGVFGRDSKNHPQVKDSDRFPFVKEVIKLACYRAREDDVIVLTRADTCFSEDLSGQLLGGSLPAYCHRYYRTEEGDTWSPMVDLFAFTKKWWQENQSRYPEFFLAHDHFWNRTLLALLHTHGAREIPGGVFRAPSNVKPGPVGTRHTYQENLFSAYQLAHGEIALAKPAVEQLPGVVVNRHALPPFAYNPSITRYQDKLWMVFRYHDQRDFSTALGVAEIDEKGTVYSHKPLQLPHNGGSEEDARFFMRGEQLWVSYVDSTYPAMPPKSVVKYGALSADTVWSVPQLFQPRLGTNDMTACEKNWVMFEYGGRLICIYSLADYCLDRPQSAPQTTIAEIKGESSQIIHQHPGPRWKWGPIRGGTTPLPYKGMLLTFFHSAIDADPPPNRRRYFIGALALLSEPPFTPIKVSQKPILWGAESDTLTPTERSSCHHWKPKVVLPLGALDLGGGQFLLSAGINDSHCALFTVKEDDLHL